MKGRGAAGDPRDTAASLICLAGGVWGGTAHAWLFLTGYRVLMAANMARGNAPGAKMLTYVYPAMCDLGLVCAVAMVVAAWGLWRRRRWGWLLALMACAGGLLASFLPSMWPFMIGLPPRHMSVFVPYLLAWAALLLWARPVEVRPVGARAFLLSLLGGMAMVLSFMNGTAALTKLLGSKMPLFIMTQPLNWLAALAWGVFAVGLLFDRGWASPVGLTAGLLALIAGGPLAYLNSIQTGEFSLFTLGPVVSLALVVLIAAHRQTEQKSRQETQASQAI